MSVEAKDNFINTVRKSPLRALTMRRTWSEVMIVGEEELLPKVKLAHGRIAVINHLGGSDIVRVDRFDRYYKRYFTEVYFTDEAINHPGTPFNGKVRRV